MGSICEGLIRAVISCGASGSTPGLLYMTALSGIVQCSLSMLTCHSSGFSSPAPFRMIQGNESSVVTSNNKEDLPTGKITCLPETDCYTIYIKNNIRRTLPAKTTFLFQSYLFSEPDMIILCKKFTRIH